MVQRASSSKSKSVHTAFKVGPPKKKPDAVSMAKAKKTKERSKKYGRGDENAKPLKKDSKVENVHAHYAAKLKKLKAENDALRKAVTAQPTDLPSIHRPEKGVAGNGFNLCAAMELEEDKTLYCTIRRCVRNLADRAGLEYGEPWHSQPKETVGKIIGAARERHKFLNRFPHCWPVEEFLKTYLKNKRAYARKQGYLSEMTNQKQGRDDDEEEEENAGHDEDDAEDAGHVEEDAEDAGHVEEDEEEDDNDEEQEQNGNGWIRGKGWGMDSNDDEDDDDDLV